MSQMPPPYNPYGAPPTGNPYGQWQKPGMHRPPGQTNQVAVALSIVSLVSGLMSFLGCCCLLLLIFPVVSLATGIPVFYMSNVDATSRGLATAGVVLASVFLTLIVAFHALGFFLNIAQPDPFGRGFGPRFGPQFGPNF